MVLSCHGDKRVLGIDLCQMMSRPVHFDFELGLYCKLRTLIRPITVVHVKTLLSIRLILLPPCCPVCCRVIFQPRLHHISLLHASIHPRFGRPLLLFPGMYICPQLVGIYVHNLLTVFSSFILITISIKTF